MSDTSRKEPKKASRERPAWAVAIAKYRNLVGLSQRQLAQKLGASQTTIASWETGQNEPSLEMFQRIAEALAVDMNWLTNSTNYSESAVGVTVSGWAARTKDKLDDPASIDEIAVLIGFVLEEFAKAVAAAELKGWIQGPTNFSNSELWTQIYRAAATRYGTLKRSMSPHEAAKRAATEVVENFSLAFVDLIKREIR